jgi:hypothetical protein
MTRLTDAVLAFLDDRGWPAEIDDGLVRTVVRTDDQVFPLAVVVVEEVGQVVVYSIFPDEVPAGRRAAVAELATRANVVLTVGNLEIELDAGQVRLRTSLGVGASPVTAEMIERVIIDNAATAVAYFPTVVEVVAGAEPVEVLQSLTSR